MAKSNQLHLCPLKG